MGVTPPPVDTEPGLAEAARIRTFWDEHFAEFTRLFPDRFVAVKEGDVVACNADLTVLYEALQELGLDPRRDVSIEFIPAETRNLLL